MNKLETTIWNVDDIGWHELKVLNTKCWSKDNLHRILNSVNGWRVLKIHQQKWKALKSQATFITEIAYYDEGCHPGKIFIFLCKILTHWGRVMHICVSKLTIIGSDKGLSPGQQ